MQTALFRVWLPAILAIALLSACQNTKAPPSVDEGAQPYNFGEIREGDTIQIAFPGATNLNSIIKVPPDGMIKLPFAGEIRATAKSLATLEKDILEAYGDQLRVRVCNVTLVAASAAFYVSGAVLRPGKYPLDRPMTVMEAVMEAGGFDNQRALPSQVTVTRQHEGRQIPIHVNLKKALRGEETDPFYLQPSDIIHVPFKRINL